MEKTELSDVSLADEVDFFDQRLPMWYLDYQNAHPCTEYRCFLCRSWESVSTSLTDLFHHEILYPNTPTPLIMDPGKVCYRKYN